MSVGEKLIAYHQTLRGGYDSNLFNEIWHDDYQGYSNSTQTIARKEDLIKTMEACKGVTVHSTVILYENAEGLVTEWKATFPANTARAEGTYAVVEWNKLKDGQIISHRTGMTSIPTSAI